MSLIGSVSNSRRSDPLLQSMGAGNKLSFSISLDDSVNTVLWCTGLLTSFAHDLTEGSRTWIPPIHHFSIPLAKPGSRKKPFWDVRNGCFWIRLQDKSNSVVAVRHNPTPALHLTNLNGGCIGVFFMTKAARQRAHELRSMPIHEISQLHVFIGFHFYRLSFPTELQIAGKAGPTDLRRR